MRPARFAVGLTGGIGTGKSSALAEFRRLGVPTLSLDAVAHAQAKPGGPGARAIRKAFPGVNDRRELAELVFKDAKARRRLERATHPNILRAMNAWLSKRKGVVVVDAPLLFEVGLQKHFDATVLISSRKQVGRVMRRDGLKPADIKRRIKAQWPLARKRALADLTLDNDKTLSALKKQVKALNAGLQLLYGGTPNGNAD